MKSYSTGQFAKLANVTERTIRYYDKIGLLKPSFVMDNGYRKYTQSDLLKLQKILSLKHLGFSLEEIFPMVLKEQNIKESFTMQINLLNSQILHLQGIRDSMENLLRNIDEDNLNWNQIITLFQMSNIESEIVKQYKDSNNLMVRISLHDQFSTNKTGWFNWLFEQIDFSTVYRLLEIGCGNGKLWENNHYNLRNREIFLSDNSEGMIEEVKEKLGNDYNYLVIDCHNIPFKNNYFDTIIANHVLFYLKDLDLGLSQISRVLKSRGTFYCTTYSKKHMQEIDEIAKNFDKRISLSDEPLSDYFGLENGHEILSKYFNYIELRKYEDSLMITQAQPLIDYILSCHGNQNDILVNRMNEFKKYIEDLIKKSNGIKITKDSGLFICTK